MNLKLLLDSSSFFLSFFIYLFISVVAEKFVVSSHPFQMNVQKYVKTASTCKLRYKRLQLLQSRYIVN
jgi:hypothetical protein